jgi:hypothetical protein
MEHWQLIALTWVLSNGKLLGARCHQLLIDTEEVFNVSRACDLITLEVVKLHSHEFYGRPNN